MADPLPFIHQLTWPVNTFPISLHTHTGAGGEGSAMSVFIMLRVEHDYVVDKFLQRNYLMFSYTGR